MRRIIRFLVLAGVATLAACASQGPATSTGAAAADTSTHLIPNGYRREVINGSEQFCRLEIPTGQRVGGKKVCLTWDQLQAQERSTVQFSQQRTSPDD